MASDHDTSGMGWPEFEREPSERADFDDLRVEVMGVRQFVQRFSRHLPVHVDLAADVYRERVAFRGLPHRQIEFKVCDFLRDPRQIGLSGTDGMSRDIGGFLVLGAKPGQPHDLGVDLGLFDHERIAGGDGFDLGIGQGRGVQVLDLADMALVGHDLPDEFGFGFQDAPHIRVERSFRDVTKDLHFGILVALAQDAAFSLLDVGRPPRGVEVMKGDQAFLHVGSRSHLLGASQRHPDLTGADTFEKASLGGIRVVILDEGDFLGGNALLNELAFKSS